nr:hypothetical protein [uncultured Halomonas sp.]
MPHSTPHSTMSGLKGTNATLQICDASSGSVRMAWACQKEAALPESIDPDLLALKQQEAAHNLFRRLFLLTTEQYLKGESGKTVKVADSQGKP